MKYGYWINHNGVYYAPGTEVPEGKAPSTPVDNEPSEPLQSVETEPLQNDENKDDDNVAPLVDDSVEDEKAAYTRTQVQQMDKATAQEVATELGVEFDEEMTVKEIKAKIMAKLGI